MREELRRSPELAASEVPALESSLRDELARLAEVSPDAAVSAAYIRIEAQLAEVLDSAGVPSAVTVGGPALARVARRHGLISDETLSAVEGLSTLRSLATHGPPGMIGIERARDYLALADAVLYALRAKPGSGNAESSES